MAKRREAPEPRDPVDALLKRTPVNELSAAWVDWTDKVDQATRDKIADAVLHASTEDYNGVEYIARLIASEILRGNIDINIARELREWVNIMLAVLAQKNPQDTGVVTSFRYIAEMSQKHTAPLISSMHTLDAIEAVQERQRVTLEAR